MNTLVENVATVRRECQCGATVNWSTAPLLIPFKESPWQAHEVNCKCNRFRDLQRQMLISRHVPVMYIWLIKIDHRAIGCNYVLLVWATMASMEKKSSLQTTQRNYFYFCGFSKARKDIYLEAMNNTRLRRNFSKPNVIKTYALFYFPTTTSDVKTCCRGKKLCF